MINCLIFLGRRSLMSYTFTAPGPNILVGRLVTWGAAGDHCARWCRGASVSLIMLASSL